MEMNFDSGFIEDVDTLVKISEDQDKLRYEFLCFLLLIKSVFKKGMNFFKRMCG